MNPALAAVPRDEYRRLVRLVFERMRLPAPSASALDGLVDYVELTALWGAKMDLVAAKTKEELVELSVADAAQMAAVEETQGAPTDRLIDVGSGGGAPGIPLLVLLAATRGLALPATLVEPRQKRVAFLRQAALRVGLSSVEVLRERSDALEAGGWETSFARATLPPPEWLVEGRRLSTNAVWLLLAREAPPEASGLEVTADVRYELPFSGVPRRALRYVRAAGVSEG